MKEAKERPEGRRSPGECGSMAAEGTGCVRENTCLPMLGVHYRMLCFPLVGSFGFLLLSHVAAWGYEDQVPRVTWTSLGQLWGLVV